jgi:hypothetical protein
MPLKKTTTKPGATDALVGSDTPGFTGGIDPKMILTTETTDGVIHSPVIAKIISLCGFSDESVMVKFIKQKQWKKLFQVTSISVGDVKDFYTVKKDGISVDEKPLKIHVRMLKCFLLYYKRKCREQDKFLSENDVMNIERDQFYSYCGSDNYFMDLAVCDKESNTKQVYTVDTSVVDVVNAPESVKTEDARDNNLYDEGFKEENGANVDVDLDTRHFDVTKGDLYFSESNIGKDFLLKVDSSQYIAHKHLKEATATNNDSTPSIHDPNGEYDPYSEDTDISKVLVDETDLVVCLDESKAVSMHPYELRGRNRSKQELKGRLIEDSFGVHESHSHGSNGDPQVDFALMTFDMHHLSNTQTFGDGNGDDDDDVDVDEDIEDDVDKTVADVGETEADDGEEVSDRLQEMVPYRTEWGTCPLCKDSGLIGNSCLECIDEGTMFESTAQWMFYNKDGVDHMIDISRFIICGESLVSLVIEHILMSTPETAVKKFLYAMAEVSSEPDIEHYVDSRSELLKLCGLKTVFDIVARSYRLHQASRFDYMNERTGEMTIVAVCNTEYELLCEVGAIWLVHQHRMQPFHLQQDMTPIQLSLFQQNRRDLGAATIDKDIMGDSFNKTYLQKHVWLGDSGASVHVTNDTASMFDCRRIQIYLKISNGKHLYSSMIGKKKVSIVQANGSRMDLILHDCMYIPDMCINLFSITKALSEGWNISNDGLQMVLSRSDHNIKFDRILNTAHGYVCCINMHPFCCPGGTSMELASPCRCLSPLGGESTSNFLCDSVISRSKIQFENFTLILSDGNPSVARQTCIFNIKGYTGQPTFRQSFEHRNGMKQNIVWCMSKNCNERKKSLENSSSNVQNIIINKILSYIEVLCYNKRVPYDMYTNNSFQHPMFTSMCNKIMALENGEQICKHGETMLSYSILREDDVESKFIKEILLPSSSMHHLNQLIFENYQGYQWYNMNTDDL